MSTIPKLRLSWLRNVKLLVAVGLAVVIGSIVAVTRASTFVAQSQTEAGAVTAPASKVDDPAASGGQAVRFSAATTPTPTPTPPAGRTCLNPLFTTSDTNGGWNSGGYYVHNNMWNASSGETLYACAYNNWYVEATGYSGTDVKTYPNVHLDLPNAFTTGVPLNSYSAVTSSFAGVGPKVGIYNVAYDVWLNGVGWGGGTTEVMIWTENMNQRPLGSIKTTYTETLSGAAFNVWTYKEGTDVNVVSFEIQQTKPSGTLNLKAMIDFAISKGYIPANPSLNQIGYGVEICSTNNTKQRFTFSDFSVTLN